MIAQDDDTREWYVRRSGTVQGPFAAERIRRYLLLGRLRLSDRVSVDGASWQPVTQWPQLIPEEMRDLGTEAGRARFEQARRAADERSVDREAAAPEASADPTLTDIPRRATARPGRAPRRPALVLLAFGGLVALAVTLIAVGYYRDFEREGVRAADCSGADSRVWNGCVKDGMKLEPGVVLADLQAINASLRDARLVGVDLTGARLDYVELSGSRLERADLRGAVLRGADLRGADLRQADLRRADLRHADLRGARIDGARLEGAMLGNALWLDGHGCAPGSVGQCR